MRIVHVLGKNLNVWDEAVKDTDICVNGSVTPKALLKTIYSFNARDVIGLIVFVNPITKQTLNLIRKFDDYFCYKKLPIIFISDDITQVFQQLGLKLVNSILYCVDSIEGTISDIDINNIFVTLLAHAGSLYNIESLGKARSTERKTNKQSLIDTYADDTEYVLNMLKSGDSNESEFWRKH